MGSHSFKSSESDEDLIDVGNLLAVIWRGKFLIFLSIFISLLIGGIYAYRIAIPLYSATSVVMLNNREEQIVDLQGVVGGLGSDTTVVNTEVEVLRSRLLLGDVVDQLGLVDDPEFNGFLQPISTFEVLKSSLKKVLGISETIPPISKEILEQRYRDAAINGLLEVLTVTNVPQSLVFRVSVVTSDPVKSSQIADEIVEQYILNQVKTKFESTEQATSWLSGRVAELQVELEEAEQKATDFRAETDLVSEEVLQSLEIQLKDTRDRLSELRPREKLLRNRAEILKSFESPQQLILEVDDEQLRRLLPRGEESSTSEEFEERVAQLLQNAREALARVSSQIRALEQSETEMSQQIERQNRDLIALQQLSREAEATRLLYEYFLTRLKETSAQQGVQQADSRILSNSVTPLAPSAPKKAMVLAASGLIGFLLGAAGVILHELRQSTFRTAEQLQEESGVGVFGQLPLLPKRQRKDVVQYLIDKPTSAAAEAVRNLRTSIMLSNVDNPPKVLMTSSSVPGEGKTTTAISLALNFSSMGRKVLLIEGDMRRRVFNKYLSGEGGSSIVDVLTRTADINDAIVRVDSMGIDVLRASATQTNAADLFSSDRFSEMVSDLREQYDTVIIDTPPVLVVPDARIIAQRVDSIIFVVKWDSTQKGQVRAALASFESVGRPVDGLVLNAINQRGMKKYGYGGEYGAYSSYGSKYYVD
ncbi:polysaccharide biosynthesis tyrosine autokinase [Salipiger profundus]|uniref:polysaccharide biosynthesis tyrosine autokinase n=1 Tax=Salipiger profundus TaxID=1229727 RepID=UPI0008E8EFDC|nr:polysaccharide biosynthesis tyrosine autokinase [Salipiger profundus]SFD95446.1 capsular exopolysaccharide family [Salipiger profundus]